MEQRPARPTIAQIREVSQPPSVTGRSNAEHWIADLYLRKISPYVTRILLRTPITANGVLWLNGDVVFDHKVLERVADRISADESFVCVNTSATSDEEVKYTVDSNGHIKELSKTVKNALGEAVGINFISSHEKAAVITQLEVCGEQDYFERGLELAIEKHGLKMEPIDISDLFAVEVDFPDDLDRANKGLK